MSTHFKGRYEQGEAVRYHSLWTLSLKVYRGKATRPDQLAGKILMQAASTILCGRPFKPSLKGLGRMCGRSSRSVARGIDALESAGMIEVRRRGKKLSNVYRLAKWLWRRLTNRDGQAPRWLPGIRSADESTAAIIARIRSKAEAARREVALATN